MILQTWQRVVFLCFLAGPGGFSLVTAQDEPLPPPAKQMQRPRRAQAQTAPTPAPAAQEVDDDEIVRVKTQLVTVPAAVTGRDGRALTNLKAENFVVYEDGKPQQLANLSTTEAPFEIALLLDTSGSTRADINLIRDAAQAFIQALRPGDRVALLAFSSDPATKGPQTAIEVLQPLTDDRELLQEKLKKLTSGYGTPLYDSLLRTVNEVFRAPPAPEINGRRALVALTDGVDSSSKSEFAPARAQLAQAGIAGYFVQIDTETFVEDRLVRDCRDNNSLRLSPAQMQRFRKIYASRVDAEEFKDFCRLGSFARMEISRALYKIARQEMNDLARVSGGRVFPVQGLDEAEAAFAQVAAEIGTQYSLGYYSSNKERDGKFRAIRVEIKGVPGAQVRAREGYTAPAN
jgi:VWFA-related protein